MCSQSFSFLINTGTKKTPKVYIFLSLYALFSLLSIPLSTNFPLFFIFFPFLLEFGEHKKAMVYSIAQTVDKALLLQGFAIVGTAFLI